jgi:hypothetical protein
MEDLQMKQNQISKTRLWEIAEPFFNYDKDTTTYPKLAFTLPHFGRVELDIIFDLILQEISKKNSDSSI